MRVSEGGYSWESKPEPRGARRARFPRPRTLWAHGGSLGADGRRFPGCTAERSSGSSPGLSRAQLRLLPAARSVDALRARARPVRVRAGVRPGVRPAPSCPPRPAPGSATCRGSWRWL